MTANTRPLQTGFHPPAANNAGAGGFDTAMTSQEFKQWLMQTLLAAEVCLYSDIATYTEPSTSAVDLASYTIPANMLSQNGEGIEFSISGITAATANNKTVLVSFGGTTIITTGAVAANNVPWILRGKIIRTGAATQEIFCEGQANSAVVVATRTAGTIDLTADQILKTNATSATASGGLTQTYALIQKISQFNVSTGA